MSTSQPLTAFQPFKAIYTLYVVSSIFVRLPLWLAYYYSPNRRPRRSWTIRKCLANEALRLYFSYLTDVRAKAKRSFQPDKEADRFALISPDEDQSYSGCQGELLKRPEIRPSAVPATWYPRPFDPHATDAAKTIILHLPPGAYVTGSERAWAPAANAICAEAEALVLCVGYRFSSAVPFPAQLQDAITAYCHLINTLHIDPKNIVISGDSAGGHCALNLLRYIEDGTLPKPSAALLCSPMTTMASTKETIDGHRNHNSDYIEWKFLNWGIETFTRGSLKRTDPFASPILHPFKTTVPLFIVAGEAEVIVDEVVAFAHEMEKIGNVVELQTMTDGSHDPLWTAFINGFQAEGKDLVKDMGQFLRKHAVKAELGK